MFRPTQALFRRHRKLALTTKDMNKGYYKGTRTGRMGTHTKWGGYIIDRSLLTPFVSQNVTAISGATKYGKYGAKGPIHPRAYLDKWKRENGID